MKHLIENKIDHYVREVITESFSHKQFSEEDWDAMEVLLDRSGQRRPIYIKLLKRISAVAAMLLLGLSLFFLHRENLMKGSKQEVTRAEVCRSSPLQSSVSKVTAKESRISLISPKAKNRRAASVSMTFSNKKDDLPAHLKYPNLAMALPNSRISEVEYDINIYDSLKLASITITRPDSGVTRRNVPAIVSVAKKAGFRPSLSLSFTAAPDVNSVNSFGGQVGTNVGLSLTVQISKRISFSSGAAYASKPYQTSFNNYHSMDNNWWTNQEAPQSIAANCKVLDIPLNLNYRIYKNSSNSLTLGAGLSSYFMLRENYNYTYANNAPSKIQSIQINNKNQHLLGVFNLNATFAHRIDNRLSALVQPYMKLPLTNIGYGQVNLRSTGVALGVSWNLNLIQKPK